jgi:hypothetical protein
LAELFWLLKKELESNSGHFFHDSHYQEVQDKAQAQIPSRLGPQYPTQPHLRNWTTLSYQYTVTCKDEFQRTPSSSMMQRTIEVIIFL